MYVNNLYRKLAICIAFVFITLIILHNTYVPSLVKDIVLSIFFVFLVHFCIEYSLLLRELSQKYQSQLKLMDDLFMSSNDLVFRKDMNFKYVTYNKAMLELVASENEFNFINKNDFDIFPKETAEYIRKYDKIALEKGQIVSYKIAKKFFSGKMKIYDVMLIPLYEKENVSGLLGIMRNITQTEELKEKIIIQNAQLYAIMDSVPIITFLKNINGEIITANKAFTDLLGCTRDELIGKLDQQVYDEQYKDIIAKEDARVIKEKKTLVFDKQIELVKEHLAWYRAIKSPIINKNNEVIGIVVIYKNIEEEKELEANKETFIANLTHDLKTPTNAQIYALNLLLKNSSNNLTDEQKEILEQTKKSCIYMSEMISTILDTYICDKGVLHLKIEEFNLSELIESTSLELANLAMEKSKKLIVNIQTEHMMISADKLQIKRVIINLVSNAINYALRNSEIIITARAEEANVFIEVENEGKYISPDILKLIFNKFTTNHMGRSSKTGTGLGLYLSKKIVNAHNGNIYAESNQNGKCKFGFSIPSTANNLLEQKNRSSHL